MRIARLPVLADLKSDPTTPGARAEGFKRLFFGLAAQKLDLRAQRTAASPATARPRAPEVRTPATRGPRTSVGSPVVRPPVADKTAAPEVPAPAGASADSATAVPPFGLIKIEPGKWYDPRTREIWTSTGEGWVNQGVASEVPKTVKVAPGMEVPLGLHLAGQLWGVRTVPGYGFFAGGQFVRGTPGEWRRSPTQEELAFGQMLMAAEGIDPRLRPHDPNPRTFFQDINLYWELVRSRGVPQTPEQAVDFYWEYQRRAYEKDVYYAQAVGWDPSIYPPPDRWSEILDQVGRPPRE